MPIPIGAVEQIAGAIKEGFKLVAQVMSGAEMRRYKYRLESAQHYIFIDAKEGQYKDIDEKEVKKLKLHHRKRVFDE